MVASDVLEKIGEDIEVAAEELEERLAPKRRESFFWAAVLMGIVQPVILLISQPEHSMMTAWGYIGWGGMFYVLWINSGPPRRRAWWREHLFRVEPRGEDK